MITAQDKQAILNGAYGIEKQSYLTMRKTS